MPFGMPAPFLSVVALLCGNLRLSGVGFLRFPRSYRSRQPAPLSPPATCPVGQMSRWVAIQGLLVLRAEAVDFDPSAIAPATRRWCASSLVFVSK